MVAKRVTSSCDHLGLFLILRSQYESTKKNFFSQRLTRKKNKLHYIQVEVNTNAILTYHKKAAIHFKLDESIISKNLFQVIIQIYKQRRCYLNGPLNWHFFTKWFFLDRCHIRKRNLAKEVCMYCPYFKNIYTEIIKW